MKNTKQHNGFSIWEFLGAIALVLVGAAIVFPMVARPHGGVRKPSCQNQLKQLGIAIAQYTQDYNERLPLLVVTPASVPDNLATEQNESACYGWADAVFPYIKSAQIYHCRNLAHSNGVPTKFAPLARDCTDYWFNGKVAGQSLKNVASPPLTLALGDGNDGGDMTDARYDYSALPAPWLSDEKAPCFRHLDGANYCFLDGHVKWLKPDQITNEPPANGKPTFAVK